MADEREIGGDCDALSRALWGAIVSWLQGERGLMVNIELQG